MRIKENKKLTDILKLGLVLILLFMVIRLFMFQNHHITRDDMFGTLRPGDIVLVNTMTYSYSTIEPGDLVYLKDPFSMDEKVIRRVAAIGGQTLEIRDKIVYVDSIPVAEPAEVKYSDERIFPSEFSNRDNLGPIQIPSGKVYLLADNRDTGTDSRLWGPVSESEIIGKSSRIILTWKPDPDVPEFKSPYITPLVKIVFHTIFHFPNRLDWDRIGMDLG
ncbi:MAG: signal peptidase I [candidate division Zixibacteria bacterium]|nr:signal peptidase I [candidate division Zixibacteria bacterium]